MTTNGEDQIVVQELEEKLLADLQLQNTQGVNSQILLHETDANGCLISGLSGSTSYGWLLIKLLWVHRDHRHQRRASALLIKACSIAAGRDCHSAWLDTSSAPAKRFYERVGFSVFATLENPAESSIPEHRRWFMRMSLKGF